MEFSPYVGPSDRCVESVPATDNAYHEAITKKCGEPATIAVTIVGERVPMCWAHAQQTILARA